MEALWSRKQEANAKRERMKKYLFSHREKRSDQNLETFKENGRWSNHLEQRVLESEAYKRREMLNCKSIACSNFLAGDMYRTTRLRLINTLNQDSVELNSLFTHPRRSFCHVKQKSIGDKTFLPNSPISPTYVVATESAKVKARSISTPKQQLGFLDTCSDYNSSPYKLGLSSWSSFNGAITNRRRGATQ
ncbi:hypothetical protein LOK49_LG10G02795 [Camellia lanceoleosa]|uniref:Uncharacterized protein n=1 Tax=Camellia lanceoleosa TaxID=1840588 RepID=A0ACC0GD42_9ERIC|nr:hypothetical protein LOK49_LG10G02795 [Camellia lanceoleosa]